jgi:hypothetical protein
MTWEIQYPSLPLPDRPIDQGPVGSTNLGSIRIQGCSSQTDVYLEGLNMTRVFEGIVWVAYSQIYVHDRLNMMETMEAHFQGQANGLCGAAVPGTLFLVTGLHTGQVGFTVDVLEAPPPIDVTWEEIIEATFLVFVTVDNLALVEWGGNGVYPIPLAPGSYRVRYCARGMQMGRDHDTNPESGEIVDSYALLFWPADPTEDCIIKQTSEIADYWHNQAFKTVRPRRAGTPVIIPPKP